MKKTIFILSTLAIVMLASGVAFTQKIKKNASGEPTGISQVTPNSVPQISHSVILEKLTMIQMENSKQYPGTVKACKETRLAFRVGGPLIKVNVKAGDRVKKGEILMQIDPRDFKDKIGVLNAQLGGALARLDNARQDFRRMKQLFDEKVIPQADFDRVTTGKDTAASGVKAIRAQLNIARHHLEYTTLKAPYNGIITQTHIENFEMVAPGRVMVGLHDISNLEININVPENEIINHPLESGKKAWVRFPSLGQQQFSVTLKEWNTTADRATRSYGTTFTLPRPRGIQIFPGMTAEIQWPGSKDQNQTLTIPSKAVVNDSTGTAHVWRFDPKTAMAAKTPVMLGALYGSSRVVVKSGLMPGDLIVTDGMDFITDTMKLSPTLANTGTARTSSQERIQ
ncbi:RND family efflux transporter, MFP subunit [Desulfocicer vacuolatum DSM 3385]|uniref:RND family efflux transporter, MFP subunit n=1 Tax=Desulfocicer vacuolatum DSM 3385 TaxID=1121400 RepID=A0A1W2C025_9BACT|nr:efflux RND transporter periplasmic adaptor subunit [Desulfocicer vacuolatum]SMC78068.1 RND family efflux transporter, MFP subunit [Desulfocicer vacuolatum DSM 3385]